MAANSIVWSGLGRFGLPVARRCVDEGYLVMPLLSAGHGAAGAARLGRPAEQVAGQHFDMLVTCLPRARDVANLIEQWQGILPPMVVDLTTGTPESSAQHAEALGALGCTYIDAPLSGSTADAGTGTLTVFAGTRLGENRLVDDFLSAIGRNVFYFGAVGRGQAIKLVNQLLHITTMAAIGEALALADAQGLDLARVVEALKTSSADSAMLRRFGSSVVARDFTTNFSLDLAEKDLGHVQEIAAAHDLDLPLHGHTLARLRAAQANGRGGQNFSAIADIASQVITFESESSERLELVTSTDVVEVFRVGGYETTKLRQGPIFDESTGMLPSRLLGYTGEGAAAYGTSFSTTYGYVSDGDVVLTERDTTWGPMSRGHYFSVVGEFVLSGSGSVALFERLGFRGVFNIGGPIEDRGRLCYIDGCSDSLLVYPPRLGDPCLNILWFPRNVRQTMHLHPSIRLAMVVSGHGRAITPDGELPLAEGSVFRLAEMSQHCFYTDSSRMAVITYHPDTDWGPTDANNPMLNRTLMGVGSATPLSVDDARTDR